MLSWLQKGLETVAAKVGDAAKLDEEFSEKSQPTVPSPAQEPALPPWESPPEQFAAEHRGEWRLLILGMLKDENTYILSPERLFELEGVRTQFNAAFDEPTALPLKPNRNRDADLHALQAAVVGRLVEVDQLRFRISPRWVSDRSFWDNLIFRLETLERCRTIEQCLDVLQILNTEPSPRPAELGPTESDEAYRRRHIGTWGNGYLLQQIRDSVLAKSAATERTKKKVAQASDALENGRNACTMLSTLLREGPGESSELIDSVAESCKYHKAKLGQLLGEIAPSSSDSNLVEVDAALYEKLLQLNEDLHRILDGLASAPKATTGTPLGAGSGKPPTVGSGGGSPSPRVGGDADAFSAQLPWDEDE